MRHIKLPIKQIVSYFVAVIMVVVLILVVNVKTEASIVQPYWDGWNKLINEGNRTLNGGNFIVTENITINSNSNGLIIKGSVTIYIADGTTLSINPYSEYNNNILNNPGILIQTGSRLIIRGNGTLNTNAIIGTFTSPPTNQGTLIILDNVTVNENNRQQNPNTLVFTGNGATLLPQDTYRKIIESNIITFCANGGSLGSVPVAIYNHDGFITQLPIAIPEFEHYEFLRWNTQPDGSGSDYYYGHIIPANDKNGRSLYAIWQCICDNHGCVNCGNVCTLHNCTIIPCNRPCTLHNCSTAPCNRSCKIHNCNAEDGCPGLCTDDNCPMYPCNQRLDEKHPGNIGGNENNETPNCGNTGSCSSKDGDIGLGSCTKNKVDSNITNENNMCTIQASGNENSDSNHDVNTRSNNEDPNNTLAGGTSTSGMGNHTSSNDGSVHTPTDTETVSIIPHKPGLQTNLDGEPISPIYLGMNDADILVSEESSYNDPNHLAIPEYMYDFETINNEEHFYDVEVPLVYTPRGAWSILNLLISISVAIVMIIGLLTTYTKATSNPNRSEAFRRWVLLGLLAVIPTIVVFVVFALTQHTLEAMVYADEWTLLFAIILLVQVGTVVLISRSSLELVPEKQDYS